MKFICSQMRINRYVHVFQFFKYISLNDWYFVVCTALFSTQKSKNPAKCWARNLHIMDFPCRKGSARRAVKHPALRHLCKAGKSAFDIQRAQGAWQRETQPFPRLHPGNKMLKCHSQIAAASKIEIDFIFFYLQYIQAREIRSAQIFYT